MAYVIGVDVGGTFTDAVLDDDSGSVIAAKAPSTPPDYSQGVLDVLELLAEQLGRPVEEMLAETHHVAHGTTSSLNALVQRQVPDVGFLTTKGHRDSIFIMNVEGRYLGRSPHELQHVLAQDKDHYLLPKRHALEVTERIDRDGNVIVALDEDEVRRQVETLRADGVEAIAVSLLWAFRNPAHEKRIRELVHEVDPDLYVALSSEVSPRIREFARHSTTIMSTQVGPGLRRYLTNLETSLRDRGLAGPLLVMQSNGGAVAATEAPQQAISTVGSVLTGGVVGSTQLGRRLGHQNIISTDVGGTTFLVGLIVDGEPERDTTTVINHHPINVPTLRVHAIGSGGGAIAWVDAGGNLRIGPHSAGAVPGPAAYDQGGTEPTNTDANLVLGILPTTGLLGGRKALSLERAREAIRTKIAEPLNLSVEDAAAAIHAAQNAQTGDLLRKTVVEAGYDPRDFVLYAFGGSGPAFCAAYARQLGVEEVVVPLGPVASAFSAYGLAASDIALAQELSDPAQLPIDPVRAEKNFAQLEDQVRQGLDRQGLKFETVEIVREIDMRYAMQLAEVTVPVTDGPLDQAALDEAATRFETKYAELYGQGSGFREAGVQAITYRVRGRGVLPFSPEFPPLEKADGDPQPATTRPVYLEVGQGFVDTPIYDYATLRAGHVLTGPAVIEVPTTTVVVPGGRTGTVDDLGNLHITPDRHEHRSLNHAADGRPRLREVLEPPDRPRHPRRRAAREPAGAHRHPGADRRARPADLRGRPPPPLVGHRRDGRGAQADVGLADRHRRERLRLRPVRRARPGGAGRALQHDARRRRRPRDLLDAAPPRDQPRHRRGRHVPDQRPVGRRRAAPERRDGVPARVLGGEALRLDLGDRAPARPRRRRARLVLPGRAGRVLRVAAHPAGQGRARRAAAGRHRRHVGAPLAGADDDRAGPAGEGRRQHRRARPHARRHRAVRRRHGQGRDEADDVRRRVAAARASCATFPTGRGAPPATRTSPTPATASSTRSRSR